MKVTGHDVLPLDAEHSIQWSRTTDSAITFATLTMGCRVNQVETERLRQGGVVHGFKPVEADAAPDLFIINTCSVTAESDRQTRQLIRRILRENPQSRLVITGCYAQGNAASLTEIPGVILVLGNSEKEQLWDHLPYMSSLSVIPGKSKNATEPTTAKVCVGDVANLEKVGDLSLLDRFSDRSRAFLQVQDGCDCRCTFCTIPALRGPSHSFSMEHIIAQTEKYLQAGYQEIVLTGINLGSYGRDLGHEITDFADRQDQKVTLASLIKHLTGLIGSERLRLSSLDPTDLDDDLIEQFAINRNLCPYLHISIQSGDDTILKRMGRSYGRHLLLDRVKRLRAARPDMVFGADLIVAFPTETPEAFQKTLDLIAEAELAFLHVFRYSDRPGTPAAAIPERFRVATEEARRRSEATRQAGWKFFCKAARQRIGKEVEVLVETLGADSAQGKTAAFLPVQFPVTTKIKPGQLVTVKITGFDHTNHHLRGCVV